MKNTLYLASKSPSRQYLLRESKIPFTVLEQNADESQCDWSLPLQDVVLAIAAFKMAGVVMPQGKQGQIAYVITADTLTQDLAGNIHGKPVDKADAIKTIEQLRAGAMVATAFCLQKKEFNKGKWHMTGQKEEVVLSRCDFDIPDHWLERYFADSVIGFEAAGGMAVEAYGMQFLKSINGSYSAVIGLPLYEVREALDCLGFFAPD